MHRTRRPASGAADQENRALSRESLGILDDMTQGIHLGPGDMATLEFLEFADIDEESVFSVPAKIVLEVRDIELPLRDSGT